MNRILLSILRHAILSGPIAAGLLFAWGSQAQQLTQTVALNPGWNAVWLEVDPSNRAPEVVFAGLPLLSAWTWSERVSATDFIQNPATAGWNRNQWLGWFPTNSPEALLGNLHSIIPARAYLVRLGGTAPVSWQVTGRVVPQPTTWSPNLYNLRGLPVDPVTPATFREFFRHSPAHWDAANDTTTPIYRLDASGVWSLVSPDDAMRRGEAYWTFVNGASDFPAPESLSFSTGDRVYFSPLAYRTTLTIGNRTAELRTVLFKSLAPPSSEIDVENILASDPNQVHRWLHLFSAQLQPGEQKKVTLYLDRTQIQGGYSETLFTAEDDRGTLQYVPVARDGEGLLGSTGTNSQTYPLAGLWLGTASLKAVGEVQATNAAAPAPVQTPFSLRLLLFVDTNGAASLMREVTLVNLPDTTTNVVTTNGSGGLLTNLVTLPGDQVLLSNPAIVNQYQSRYAANAGVMVRRFTAAQFDNSVNPDGVPLPGSFLTNGTVSGNLSIPFDYATNPYYHRYHPDHDNLDPTYQHTVPEALSISRNVVFDFTPIGSGVPSYGVDGLDGNYRETVSGLHKVPLLTSGTFVIQRISNVQLLNPPLH
jgi:hypothetical protein